MKVEVAPAKSLQVDPPPIPAVSVQQVSKAFSQQRGGMLEVLASISFDAPAGGITSILGPSGCGKSTLLHIIAGLTRADSGTIKLFGESPEPIRAQRRLGYVFQEDRLLPWRTALKNVSLGLEAAKVEKAERLERARQALALVGLMEFCNSFPYQLSGGMRSRVALARSLVLNPDILLMDEPFGRLDAQTRGAMHTELLQIWEKLKTSILFVTHDVEEAVVLADRVVVLAPRPGRIKKIIDVNYPRPRLATAPDIVALIHQLRGMLAEEESREERT